MPEPVVIKLQDVKIGNGPEKRFTCDVKFPNDDRTSTPAIIAVSLMRSLRAIARNNFDPADFLWIPVELIKPDSDTTVLVGNKDWDNEVDKGYHDGEVWRTMDGFTLDVPPTHWRNLPILVI